MECSSNRQVSKDKTSLPPASHNGRMVTVMFVDVVDSTRIFENIDPEYVHQIMVGCFEILLNEVHKHNGTINQFRGDCTMAIFSSVDDAENHALYACRAALGIVKAIQSYNHEILSKHNIPFQVRIGLNSGPVMTGAIGKDLQVDFVIDCDTTHHAALLESNATPGSILISPTTGKQVASFFNLQPWDNKNNKAMHHHLQGFELIGEQTSLYQYCKSNSSPRETYTPKHLADKILTTRSSIEGERKYITVMFVGLPKTAVVYEYIQPESINEIMGGCFKILRNQIYSFGGVINQFRGDCVMALFGAPTAHEDHSARACHAALGIMKAVQEYSKKIEKEYALPFQVTIGLNTGRVVAGSIGNNLRRDYTADGDTSNLAARMLAYAKPGTTLLSGNTFKRISQLFKFDSLGNISVKGKNKSVEAYVLLGEKLHRPRLGLERRIYSAMVGRNKELKELEGQVKKLLDGSGGVINIIGEAGIGKSRLVAEMMTLDILNKVKVLEGNAISIGSTLSFYPVIDLLKNWAGIAQKDSQITALKKLETAVVQLYPQQSEEIIPFVATLMGMELTGGYAKRIAGISGEPLEKLIFKNLRELIIQLSTSRPLVIIFEDLHWADLSSIGFIQSIFNLAQSHPILFINPLRPGYQQTTERLITTLKEDVKEHYLEIPLVSLDALSSETLIHNMLNIRGLSIPLTNQIVQRSDGNPYFIEEVVRSFIEEGALVAKDGVFASTDKIHDVVIPNTIIDLLTARIDRLEEKNRDLVKTASVIGRNFFYRILKMVTESIVDIDQRLTYLKDIQMIFERQRIEEIEYLFTHALAQEAAYESILFEKRKPLHLKVAQSIEELFAANLHEFYGYLSFHYSKGENFFKAEEYLLRSGEEALKSSASSEAIMFFKEGLRLYQNRLGTDTDPKKVAYMQRCIAISYYNKGQLVESIPFFNEALEYYGIKESKNAIADTSKTILCLITFVIKLYIPTLRKYKTASENENIMFDLWFKKSTGLAVSSKAAFFRDTIQFISNLFNYDLRSIENGASYLLAGSVLFSYGGLSFTLSKQIIKATKKSIDKKNAKDMILYGVSEQILAFLSGTFKKEVVFDETLVQHNLNLGETVFTTFYINQFIFQNIEKGNFKDTIDLIEKENEIIEIYRCDFSLALLLYLHARVLLKMRNLTEALKMADLGLAQAIKTGDVTILSQIYSIKARMYIFMNDLEQADKTLKMAEEIKLEAVLPFYLVEIHLSRFILEFSNFKNLHINDPMLESKRQQTLTSGEKAARTTRRAQYNSVELYRYMGLFFWHTSQKKKTWKYWKKSIDKGKFMGARPELARTYFEVGRHLALNSSKPKRYNGLNSQDYLNLSKKMFEDMDLRWDIERLNKITLFSKNE